MHCLCLWCHKWGGDSDAWRWVPLHLPGVLHERNAWVSPIDIVWDVKFPVDMHAVNPDHCIRLKLRRCDLSTVSLRDLGAKEFELTLHLSLAEAVRIGRDRLVGSRGTLLDRPDGGVDVSFSFYIRAQAQAQSLVDLMLFFGEGGAFEAGAAPDPAIFRVEEPDSQTIQAILGHIAEWKMRWQARWQGVVQDGLRRREPRIEMMRQIQDRFGDGVSETLVRNHLLKLLRKRYGSEIFAATCLWRMGWESGQEWGRGIGEGIKRQDTDADRAIVA